LEGNKMTDVKIKDWGYAAYIFPLREIDGKKQIMFFVYKSDWHGTLGGRIDKGEDARSALSREIGEELLGDVQFITDNMIEAPEKHIRKVPETCIERRRAYNEEHTFFVVKIPTDFELILNKEDLADCRIEWVDIKEIKNHPDKFRDTRENARSLISFLENL